MNHFSPSGIAVRFLRLQQLSPAMNGICQALQNVFGIVPSDAGVSDADAILQAGFAFLGDFLRAWPKLYSQHGLREKINSEERTFVDIALDHNAKNRFLAILDLLREIRNDLGLILVVLERVAM